jgi:hypothetical protein
MKPLTKWIRFLLLIRDVVIIVMIIIVKIVTIITKNCSSIIISFPNFDLLIFGNNTVG